MTSIGAGPLSALRLGAHEISGGTSHFDRKFKGFPQDILFILRLGDICTFLKGDKETPIMTKNKYLLLTLHCNDSEPNLI